MAVSTKMAALLIAAPCSSIEVINVSEALVASIVRAINNVYMKLQCVDNCKNVHKCYNNYFNILEVLSSRLEFYYDY